MTGSYPTFISRAGRWREIEIHTEVESNGDLPEWWSNGVGEPKKVQQIDARGKELLHKFVTEKNGRDYIAPCAKAFPATQAGTFKELPADSPDTRMMCYTLSTALLQMFAGSDVAPVPRSEAYVRLNNTLDQALQAEVNLAGENLNVAELSGRAMRGLAQSVYLGRPPM